MAWEFLAWRGYFEVKRVLVNGGEVSGVMGGKILGEEKGVLIFDINMEALLKRVSFMYGSLRVEVFKRYPDTIEVRVISGDLAGVLREEGDEEGWLVDTGGFFVGKVVGIFGGIPDIRVRGFSGGERVLGGKVGVGVIGSVIEGLGMVRRLDEDFFKRIQYVDIGGAGGNYFMIEGLAMRFRFGGELRREKLLELIVVEEDLAKFSAKEVDLRYVDMVLRVGG